VTIPIEEIRLPILQEKEVSLFLKREDVLHPLLSGNKFRKLKYNIQEAQKKKAKTLITFGGAYSNHIPATAFAAREHGFKAVGIIRGEELRHSWSSNPTLLSARELGMTFSFVSREAYRSKASPAFLDELSAAYEAPYIIPEGGTNALAVKGCEEILTDTDTTAFDTICCAVGTGGTLAGIINGAREYQQVLGFPALKGDFLKKDIFKFVTRRNWELSAAYHFGGYAKITAPLVMFINDFKAATGIPLDPVYTGKMMFGILDLVGKDHFKTGTSLLAIHTGGLQGVAGMNEFLKKKKLPLLAV